MGFRLFQSTRDMGSARCVVVLTVCVLFAFTCPALGADPAPVELPALRPGYPFGTTLGRDDLRTHREVVPVWLAERILNGSWVIDAARELSFAWRLDDDWERMSALASTRALGKGVPDPQWFHERSWVFGRLPQQRADASGDLAAKILWNVQSMYAGSANYGGELTFIESRANGERARFNVDWQRVVPPPAGENRLPQLFRERLRIVEPGVLAGMAWLTFRFFGAEEDLLWSWSRAIEKTRQLTGANRADALLTSNLALDDLLGWSGKAELVQPVLIGSVTQLAPFWPFLIPLEVEAGTGCLRVRPSNEVLQRSDGLWNLHTGRFVNGAPWLPTAAVYVPREMWILELQPRDPFSAYGRQTLFIDRLSQLPVYKLVYARDGTFLKIVVSVFGLAATSDHQRKLPVPVLTLIEDVPTQAHTMLEVNRFMSCAQAQANLPLAEFEARHLGPRPSSSDIPLPTPSQPVEISQ